MKSQMPTDIDVFFGKHEIKISRRYEFYYNVNDILIALWFIIGSILFFKETTSFAGTWFFLIGSVQLLIRPVIRIIRSVHLKKSNEKRSKR
ncbi:MULTISPECIES: YrhK family protein [Paraliobacillus]|uniref:YrhK family protein n=1 Tax=Paraliobacillus TaxID=200903 RepID=UPI000DD374FE|nr:MULTISPECIES: YrhK family protein [Paraliobacillus]